MSPPRTPRGAVLNIFVISTAPVGLLEVGHSLANPLGAEAEDFAVLTFLRDAVANSRLIMEGIEREPIQRAEKWAAPAPHAHAPAPAAPVSAPVPTPATLGEGSSDADAGVGVRREATLPPPPDGLPPPVHPPPSPSSGASPSAGRSMAALVQEHRV